MMMSHSLLLLLLLMAASLPSCGALKFLAYNPMWGRSHSNFIGKITDTLINAGHEVVMVVPLFNTKIGLIGTDKARIVEVPQCAAAAALQRKLESDAGFVHSAWRSQSIFALLGNMPEMVNAWIEQCNVTVNYPGLIQRLRDEKFDAAFGESMDLCIFVHLGIEKFALTQSVGAFDGAFVYTGAPSAPSYVPGMMAYYGDRMTFGERFANAFAHVASVVLAQRMFYAPFNEAVKRWSPEMPTINEMMVNNSLMFMNSDPLVDFPKVTTHKVIDIGGITVSSGYKPLNKTWDEIFSRRPKTVLLSFGSVAKSFLMPAEYKESIRLAFSRFPDVTFIWKYESPEDDIGKGIPNIVPVTWVPQNDMLYDPRLSLFITHCGAGSTTEATVAGVPLIVIPVMGDQRRNAQIGKRLGTGVTFDKDQLATPDALVNALNEVFASTKYTESAKKTAALLANRPFTMKEIFVRNMEFLAKFGPLRNLDHYGVQLNFFQYYLLDVIAAVAGVLLLLLTVILLVLRVVIRKLLGLVSSGKAKKE